MLAGRDRSVLPVQNRENSGGWREEERGREKDGEGGQEGLREGKCENEAPKEGGRGEGRLVGSRREGL